MTVMRAKMNKYNVLNNLLHEFSKIGFFLTGRIDFQVKSK